jgi:hypothetical protein
MRWLLVPVFLCGSAFGVVPVNTCHQVVGSGTSASCSITVSPHHALLTFFWSNNGPIHTYTDSAGNSSASQANCSKSPVTAQPACAGSLSVYDLGYSSGLASEGLVAVSSGTFSGSDTFTITTSTTVGIEIFVAEYGEDLLAFERTNNTTAILTTTGLNDLIVVQAGKGFSCNFTTVGAPFTVEFLSNTTCHAVADAIDLPPGTYDGTIAETTGGADIEPATAFGVAPFVANVRHRSEVY